MDGVIKYLHSATEYRTCREFTFEDEDINLTVILRIDPRGEEDCEITVRLCNRAAQLLIFWMNGGSFFVAYPELTFASNALLSHLICPLKTRADSVHLRKLCQAFEAQSLRIIPYHSGISGRCGESSTCPASVRRTTDGQSFRCSHSRNTPYGPTKSRPDKLGVVWSFGSKDCVCSRGWTPTFFETFCSDDARRIDADLGPGYRRLYRQHAAGVVLNVDNSRACTPVITMFRSVKQSYYNDRKWKCKNDYLFVFPTSSRRGDTHYKSTSLLSINGQHMVISTKPSAAAKPKLRNLPRHVQSQQIVLSRTEDMSLNATTLAVIRAALCRKSVTAQIAAHLARPLYVEQPGLAYFNMNCHTPSGLLMPKCGRTVDIARRRREYKKCETGVQEIVWAVAYECAEPKRVERLVHLRLRLLRADLVLPPCLGCKTKHKEFASFEKCGGIEGMKAIIEGVLTDIGEPVVILQDSLDASDEFM
ncbi:hypothetical protein B0H12DRAFT_1077900 [Mycena haematopus]|nr:hypothetical protein B0H12DRAFT_1077900 [Mycena haematopus]